MASQFKIFYVGRANGSDEEEELNLFLRQRRVVKVERFFSATSNDSFWTFCVEYLPGAPPATSNESRGSNKTRIDYRDVLSDEDFQLYAELREWRKRRAFETSAPVYTVLTNEQLAAIATRRPRSRAELGRIPGIGESKSQNYGSEILAILQSASPREGKESGCDASGP